MMSDFKKLQDLILKFRDDRNWKQFHNPKDLAIGLNLEATEVLEHFLWKTNEEVYEYLKTHKNDIAEELADTLYYVLLMAVDLEINIEEAFINKMELNNRKYDVKKAKGNHKKYTELEKE